MEPLLSTEGVKRRPLLSPLLHPESLFNFTTTTQVTTTTTRNHHHHQQHHHNNCLQTSCHHRILPFISSSVQPKKSISHLPSFLTTMTILLLLGVTFLSSIVTASQSSIRLDGSNNGYTGIVVSFSPNIQISQRETMVREMQVSWYHFLSLTQFPPCISVFYCLLLSIVVLFLFSSFSFVLHRRERGCVVFITPYQRKLREGGKKEMKVKMSVSIHAWIAIPLLFSECIFRYTFWCVVFPFIYVFMTILSLSCKGRRIGRWCPPPTTERIEVIACPVCHSKGGYLPSACRCLYLLKCSSIYV